MGRRAGLNEVKFKVRHKALLLQEFTVQAMVDVTGLNPESIRTELQRMRREGFLSSQPSTDERQGRGGRPSIYKLSDDPEIRLRLMQSLEAFFSPPESIIHPTNHYFSEAQRLLDQAEFASGESQIRILNDAEFALEVAEDTEGGELAPESVQKHIKRERDRLTSLRNKAEEDDLDERMVPNLPLELIEHAETLGALIRQTRLDRGFSYAKVLSLYNYQLDQSHLYNGGVPRKTTAWLEQVERGEICISSLDTELLCRALKCSDQERMQWLKHADLIPLPNANGAEMAIEKGALVTWLHQLIQNQLSWSILFGSSMSVVTSPQNILSHYQKL